MGTMEGLISYDTEKGEKINKSVLFWRTGKKNRFTANTNGALILHELFRRGVVFFAELFYLLTRKPADHNHASRTIHKEWVRVAALWARNGVHMYWFDKALLYTG
jgi:hypothetical protein